MARQWETLLDRWVRAALIDAAAADRIRAFEAGQAESQRFRWPIALALSFGGILLGAGVLLFVAAHWDELSPSARLTTVLLMVSVFHVAGAWCAARLEAFATMLHGVGTISLGAGIFLTGQIFHLQAHWPAGMLLWALGAWIGWALRRDWVQPTLAALLTPAWLAGEWTVAAESYREGGRVLAMGVLLAAITYFSARTRENASHLRRALVWAGGIAFIPSVITLVLIGRSSSAEPIPIPLSILGWSAAFAFPLATAAMLRGTAVWTNVLAAVWVLVLGRLRFEHGHSEALLVYFWCALGAVGLVAWGLHEGRRERINLGVAGFALTLLFFYFSSVMDKLGRSASLIGLGILFLGGGWMLERARRGLVARLGGSAS